VKGILLRAGFFAWAVCASGTASAQLTDQAKAELRSLHWLSVTNLRLSASHSEIRNLPDYIAVTGEEALRARQIADADSNQNIEADIINPNSNSEVVFDYTPSGYVTSTDWTDVDPLAFLDQIKKNTEIGNRNRRSRGLTELHVTGWVQQPSLNPDTHTVSWVISASGDDGSNIVNAIALKLGRYGYERIVLIDGADRLSTAVQNLLFIANSHRFDAGSRYDDYVSGQDRSAEYGVAGLVAGVLGVKLLKVAAAGGLLLIFKKAAWIILLPVFWLWRLIRPKRTKPTSDGQASAAAIRIEPTLLPSAKSDTSSAEHGR
jgi:uncharacterized membrane-anchored protein